PAGEAAVQEHRDLGIAHSKTGPRKDRPEPASALRQVARRDEEIGMDRPSSLAARPRQTRVARASHGKRMYLRLALLALSLASASGGRSMWDWIAGSAVAEPRGAQSADFAAASEDEALP